MDSAAPELPSPLVTLIESAVKQALNEYTIQKTAAPYISRPIAGTLDDFCEFLRHERARKPSTIGDYRRDVNLFAAFIEATFKRPAETSDMTGNNFGAFIAAERRAGRASSSVARRAHGLRAYWGYLAKRQLAPGPLTFAEMGLTFKRVQTHQRILTCQEFLRLCTLTPRPPSPLS